MKKAKKKRVIKKGKVVKAKPKPKKRSKLPKLIRKLEKALSNIEAGKKKAAKVSRAELTKANEAALLRAVKLAKKRGRSKQYIEDLQSDMRDSYVEELDLVESEIPYIMSELIAAEDEGNLDSRAYELAEEFDWDPHEVYSLWYGYEPD